MNNNNLERRPTKLPAARFDRLARRAIIAASAVATVSFVAHVTFDGPVQWDLDVRSKLIIGTPAAVEEAIRELQPIPIAQRAAFPGAEGFASGATWGLKWRSTQVARASFLPLIAAVVAPNDSVCNRSNAVISFVTNTNDSGAGSLRYVLANDLKRDTMNYIIFRTGGTITTTSEIGLGTGSGTPGSCVYIAGQTAPGGGIQLRGDYSVHHLFRLESSGDIENVIVRFLRLRQDSVSGSDRNCLSNRSGSKVIYDHLSVSYCRGQTFEVSTVGGGQTAYNFTFQWLIASMGLDNSEGVHVRRSSSAPRDPNIGRVDMHDNLLSHISHRQPRLAEGTLDTVMFINNVVYDWGSRMGRIRLVAGEDRTITADYLRNYLKCSPRDTNCRSVLEVDNLDPDVYLARNIVDTTWPDSTVAQDSIIRYDPSGNPFTNLRADSLSPAVPVSWTQLNAHQARDAVLDSAGASLRLDCDGSWLWARDELDDTIVNNVEQRLSKVNGTAWVDFHHSDDWYGVPTLAAGTACTDTDSDGMPDVWEDAKGLDKNSAADATQDKDGDGYINLEEYLNGTTP